MESSIEELFSSEEYVVDENVFWSLKAFVVDKSVAVTEARSLFCCKCSKCLKRKQSIQFVTNELSISAHCNECRRTCIVDEIPQKIYFCGDLDDCRTGGEAIAAWHSYNHAAARNLRWPIECVYYSWRS